MPIQKLPIQLANQIAAGEVVERPASVVKELVENSIDAGATDIQIDIERGGHRRIRIRDNGSGIAKDELTLALSRHATSKIASLDDLEAILSLGFRGEALASISSVSRLTLSSKTEPQESGWKAFCEGRDMDINVEPTSHLTGTTVDVEDLFFNTPARRKFLRTEKTEFGHIDEVIRRIALACPNIAFKLTHNGQTSKHYPIAKSENTSKSRVGKVIGQRFVDESLRLESQVGDVKIQGWVSPPQACRHQQDAQYFFVNGRMMRDKLLNHAVRQAFGTELPEDRYATYILYLTLPAQDVDVNVHPAKHEVRFHQSRQVHDFVLSAVRSALGEVVSTESSHGYEYQPPDPSRYKQVQSSSPLPATPSPGSSGNYSGSGSSFGRASSTPGKKSVETFSKMLALQTESSDVWQPIFLLPDALLCVKRQEVGVVSLAKLMQKFALQSIDSALKQGMAGQPLLLPTQFEYEGLATLMTDYHQHLSLLGIELRPTSGSRAAVLKVPSILRRTAVAETLPELLSILEKQHREVALVERQDVLEWLAVISAETSPSLERANAAWQGLSDELKPEVLTLDWLSALESMSDE